MPTLKLTKSAIAKLPAPHPSGKQVLYWDSELKGLGVLVSGTTASKTYVTQHTMTGGNTRRMTIGPVNALELEGADGARARARALIAQFYSGVDPKAEQRRKREEAARQAKGTLRIMLTEYLSKRQLNPNTKQYYQGMAERYLAPWLDIPLRTITHQMVKERHTQIAQEVARRNAGTRRGGALATGHNSANMAMHVLSIIWKWTAKPHRIPDLGQCPTWILTDDQQWYETTRRARLVKGDDLPAFYKAVDALESRTARDYILVLLFTGMRRGETASLRWDDVDFSGRVIRLPAAVTKSGRKLDLPMSSFVRDLLVARRALGREGTFVFSANSKSGHVEDPSFALSLVAKATGIETSAHDLRRTFLTVAESCEMSPLALKALVNHVLPEKGDVTAGYIQMTVERLRGPAQRVCDQIAEVPAENVVQLG